MKLVRFLARGSRVAAWGVVEDDAVRELVGMLYDAIAHGRSVYPLAEVRVEGVGTLRNPIVVSPRRMAGEASQSRIESS